MIVFLVIDKLLIMYFISGEEKSEQIIFSNSKSLRALEIFLDLKTILATDILNELVFLGDKKKNHLFFFTL